MSDMRAWEIPTAIELIADMMVDLETGECLSDDEVKKQVEELQMEFDKKVTYICKLIQNESDSAEMYKAHKDAFDKKQKASEKRVKSLKNYLAYCLKGEKWESEDKSVKVQFRTNKDTLKVDTLADIPEEYFKTPHYESNLNKTAIKEALAGGKKVAGVHLEDTISTIVK